MNSLTIYLERFRDYFRSLTVPQRISYTGGAIIFIGALVFLVYVTNRTDYTVLYSGLSQSDMGEIAQALKAKKVEYRIDNGNIEVAREHLYDTRLTLAAEGIPKGAGSGFEIFDQQKLGSTEFVQKINYQRALQGELARTINGMNEVLESRVHLVLPEESLFKEDNKPPSAAVVLKLRAGARIEQKQLQGIVNLVAATVRGLDESRISVISTDGQVLFKKSAPESLQMSNVQVERKQRMEDDMRQKVQTMLEQVIGPNKVLARVNLDLDFNQVQIAEETYNPDSAVIRSQQRSTEASEGKEGVAKGNPDAGLSAESKLLQSAPASDSSSSKGGKQFNRQREVVNYEINKVSKQVVQMPGNIKKVSVAVIVDGKYESKPGSDSKAKPTYVPRSAEEMKSIDDLVRKAVGYSETRGDQITVSNIPFASDAGGDMVQSENKWLQLLKSYQKILLNAGLIVAILFFVIKPLMNKFKQVADDIKRLPAPTRALEDPISALLMDAPGAKISIRKQSSALVKHNPEKATEIIKSWLKDEV